MRRLTSFIMAAAAVFALVQAPTVDIAYGQRVDATSGGASPRATAKPPSRIPVDQQLMKRTALNAAIDGDEDSLSSSEILQRIGRIYDYQARILSAASTENFSEAEDLLDRSMTELQQLMVYPEVVDRPQFRELYRTVITEYERHYQVPADSLALPFGDIFAIRSDIFEVLNSINEPLLEDVNFPSFGPVATTIPMTSNRLVQQSISYLTKSPDKHLYRWLGRAETYFPMIERILAEEGVPDELKYLAMIESGLNPRAKSWAAANGMWQFISATGRAYGLQVNSWVDERLDPEKSTRAAARHLKDLYAQFGGDWQLAMAGYNCSPARVKRAIRRAEARLGRKATFWDIYTDIPRETRNYVPMFIAASLVASNPEEFGLSLNNVNSGPEYAYHYVPVRGFLSLSDIAAMSRTDETTIRALNPELRRDEVPPSAKGYFIRIPIGTYDAFADAYSRLPAAKKQSSDSYVIRRGDTLGKIARKYGVSVSTLMQTNSLRSTTIRVGQRLVVPVPSYDSNPILADLNSQEVLTVEYGRKPIRPILAANSRPDRLQQRGTASTPVRTASMTVNSPSRSSAAGSDVGHSAKQHDEEPEPTTRIVYTVRRGDNLTDIGRKYGVSVQDIRRWNTLSGSKIQVGQRLHLFETNPDTPAEKTIVYRVRRGDTLGAIAKRHGVGVSQLRKWNNLSTSVIRVGQRLSIHGGSAAPAIYTVRRGDNLTEIAKKHGVTIRDLKRWNSLKSTRIHPGQKLKVTA